MSARAKEGPAADAATGGEKGEEGRKGILALRDEWERAKASMKQLEDRTVFSVNSQTDTVERLTREVQQMREAIDVVNEQLGRATAAAAEEDRTCPSPGKRYRGEDGTPLTHLPPPQQQQKQAAPPAPAPFVPTALYQVPPPAVVQSASGSRGNVTGAPPPQQQQQQQRAMDERIEKLERLVAAMSICPGEQRAMANVQQTVDAKLKAVVMFLPAVDKVIDNVKNHAVAIAEVQKGLVDARAEIASLNVQVSSVMTNVAPDFGETFVGAYQPLLSSEEYASLGIMVSNANELIGKDSLSLSEGSGGASGQDEMGGSPIALA